MTLRSLYSNFFLTFPKTILFILLCFVLCLMYESRKLKIDASSETLILEDDQGPCGYIMGVLDSQTYYQWMHSEWLPKIRVDYKKPTGDPDTWDETEKITNLLFHPVSQRLLPDYPAHLHIDLLSRAQGKGQGKLMMDRFTDYLRYNKILGLHLELSSNNKRAFNFYSKYGMDELDRDNESIIMGYYL